MTLKAFIAFLGALPELLKLIQDIQKQIEKSEAEKKAKDDVKTIREAFRDGDAQKLNDLFANK